LDAATRILAWPPHGCSLVRRFLLSFPNNKTIRQSGLFSSSLQHVREHKAHAPTIPSGMVPPGVKLAETAQRYRRSSTSAYQLGERKRLELINRAWIGLPGHG
jgi:hypothetical protein